MGPNSLMVVHVDPLGIIGCNIPSRNMSVDVLPYPYPYIYIYWVPVLKSLYNFILSITQEPTIWVPGLLGITPIFIVSSQTLFSDTPDREFLGFSVLTSRSKVYLEVHCTSNLLSNCSYKPIISRVAVVMELIYRL